VKKALWCSLPCLVLALGALPARGEIGTVDAVPGIELFPVLPGVDVQRGFAVAVDGDWMAMGAPLDDTVARDAGAVHLFQWNLDEQRWVSTVTLYPPGPAVPGSLVKSRFGGALALHDGILAVGALGEGAVYVYQNDAGVWDFQRRASGQTGRFGRSVAVGGGRLAVGEVAPNADAPSAVFFFATSNSPGQKIKSGEAGGNRFGEALALDGDTLVVGDPASQKSKGAVSVYGLGTGAAVFQKLLTAPGGQAGDQLGAAVALSGDRLTAGAPTAGVRTPRRGAVYTAQRLGASWSGLELLTAGLRRGDQLGSSLALEGDLLAAGAPAPVTRDGRLGAVRMFWHSSGTWTEVPALRPDNGENRDLVGFAVALRGGRVALGAVIGDQGGGAAGAAWSFTCSTPGGGCAQEGEAVVTDAAGPHVGTAVAISGQMMAVAASPSLGPFAGGAVYVYRRAGTGWRQEARLTSLHPETLDGFGASLALEGETLAVGAPQDTGDPQVSPPPNLGGLVYVFQHGSSGWRLDAALPPVANPGGSFGTALALAGGVLAVGAPDVEVASTTGAVYLFQRNENGWIRHVSIAPLGPHNGGSFGAALAFDGKTLAAGAPHNDVRGVDAGAVAVFNHVTNASGETWGQTAFLASSGAQQGAEFGGSLSLSGTILAVGTPRARRVDLFDQTQGWNQATPLVDPSESRSSQFGATVSLRGDNLLVGAPGTESTGGEVHLFRRSGAGWTSTESLQAVKPVPGDGFGSATALDGKALVVASPGLSRGDRVTVFTLQEPQP
jgi:hypothetical protein